MPENNTAFFKMGVAVWWKIREQFKRTMPTNVTPTYLATALSQEEKSVRVNILPPLKRMGLVDETGRPTELAYEWRDDGNYPIVCKKILEQNYPQELRDLFSSDDADNVKLVAWFARVGKVGDATAKMMAAFYRLLLRADPLEQSKQGKPKEQKLTNRPRVKGNGKEKPIKVDAGGAERVKPDRGEFDRGQVDQGHQNDSKSNPAFGNLPQLHINIQLHIAPETTTEQIERIFESMAKHLREFTK